VKLELKPRLHTFGLDSIGRDWEFGCGSSFVRWRSRMRGGLRLTGRKRADRKRSR
jgi:hypothetical protein